MFPGSKQPAGEGQVLARPRLFGPRRSPHRRLCSTSAYIGAVMNALIERRERRSPQHSLALRYQLESTLKRGRMAALALTDRTGLLLAWAGEDSVCEELGAVAPMVLHGWPAELDRNRIPRDDVSVR